MASSRSNTKITKLQESTKPRSRSRSRGRAKPKPSPEQKKKAVDPSSRFVVVKDVKHFHHFETPKAIAAAATLELLSAVFNVANVWYFRNNFVEVALCVAWHLALWVLPLRLLRSDVDRKDPWNQLYVYFWISIVLGMPYVKVARENAPWVGAVHGAASLMTTIRFTQMWKDTETYKNFGPFMRFYTTSAWGWHDLRKARFVKRDADVLEKLKRQAQIALVMGTIFFSSFAYLFLKKRNGDISNLTHLELLERWLAGSALLMSWFSVMDAFVCSLHLLTTRFEMEPIMDDYYKARTISEFWGLRWNLPIQDVLFHGVYKSWRPVLGSTLAKILVFAVSAWGHCYFLFIAKAPWHLVWSMAAYFLVQLPLLKIEETFGLSGFLWTFGTQALLIPLFVEPILTFCTL